MPTQIVSGLKDNRIPCCKASPQTNKEVIVGITRPYLAQTLERGLVPSFPFGRDHLVYLSCWSVPPFHFSTLLGCRGSVYSSQRTHQDFPEEKEKQNVLRYFAVQHQHRTPNTVLEENYSTKQQASKTGIQTAAKTHQLVIDGPSTVGSWRPPISCNCRQLAVNRQRLAV